MLIAICGSLKFFDKMTEVEGRLRQMGHDVCMPVKVPGVDYWTEGDEQRVHAKRNLGLISEHLRKIEQADAVLAINMAKREIANYIGFNTAAEIVYAYYLQKKIWLLNPIPDQPYIADELRAIGPTILNGNFGLIGVNRCGHRSVGVIVKSHYRFAMLERATPPFGWAAVAGHVDEACFLTAARRELKEELGLEAASIELVMTGEKSNRCRRVDGNWHYWEIYLATFCSSQFRPNPREVKQAAWLTAMQIAALARKTETYLAGQVSEIDWRASPGLEPVWCEWLTELGII